MKVINHFLLALLIGCTCSSGFADDLLDVYDSQTDEGYAPSPEENYIAVIAPLPSMTTKYIGLNIGANYSSVSRDVSIGTNSGHAQDKTFGYLGGFYSGCGKNLGNLYIGTELGVFYNSLNRKFHQAVDGVNTKITIHQPLIVSFDFIPGYLTRQQDWLFYGRVGVGGSLVKLDFNDKGDAARHSTNERIRFGWRAGVGIQYFFCDYFSMRFEYIYSRYNKLGDNFTSGDSSYSYRGEIMGINQCNIGLTIHF